MLSSFVRQPEHPAFRGVVCGYLGFEGTAEQKGKKKTTPRLR